jgi:integrase
LRSAFGGSKTLLKSLKTTDINVARAARHSVLHELRLQIEKVRSGIDAKSDPLDQEAMKWREYLATVPDDHETALDRIVERAQEIAYTPPVVGASPEEEEDDPKGKKAQAFYELATGKATPIGTYVDRWLAATTYSDRTKADARTAITQLIDWFEDQKRPCVIERIDDRAASDFRDSVFTGKAHPKTANKKLSALRQYWAWLDRSFGIRPNPWDAKSLPKPKQHQMDPDGPGGRERPFTDEELRLLLLGNADADLRDMMMIAALSGMRLEEIGQLRIGDCQSNVFNVRRSKTAAGIRAVPIHPLLMPILRRRVGGRQSVAYLFPDLRDTGWDGNRTMAVSKRFATYRRRMGVDDRRERARRSKVNFHSFRRWFATKSEEAGNRENVVEAVMGQAKGGMAFGVYSQAELTDLKRKCVESVRLPALRKKQII